MIELSSGAGALFAAGGLATLAAALLPRVLRHVPISMPMVFLAEGMAGFAFVPSLPDPDPQAYGSFAVHLTEVCVIVSLMGAGLALNRPIGWRTWSSTWRPLTITMALSMVAVGALGWSVLGLGVASAVLLAAALAPTDPVLASEVQVSEPVTEPGAADDEARFALTSEAGLNDGLAFPFTYAAIAISLTGVSPGGWLLHWALVDVLWRPAVGVPVGLSVGWLFGKLFFATVPKKLQLAEKSEGFVALAATFIAYGMAELAQGYGFIAVFICACTIRMAEQEHGYHGVLHTFVEQIERVLTVAVIVLLGGAVARGLLADLGWREVAVALAFLLVIRPLAGWVALTPGKTGPGERAVIALFRSPRRWFPLLRRLRAGARRLPRRGPPLGNGRARRYRVNRHPRSLSHASHGSPGRPTGKSVEASRQLRCGDDPRLNRSVHPQSGSLSAAEP